MAELTGVTPVTPQTLRERQSSSRPHPSCLGGMPAPLGARIGSPPTPIRFKPSAWPCLPALSALAPATLPSAMLASLPDLCTCRVFPWKLFRSSLHLVNIHLPFRVELRYRLLQEAFPDCPWPGRSFV